MKGTCDSARINLVYLLIGSCTTSDTQDTANCITDGFYNKRSEYWDAIVQKSTENAGITYWYYSDCTIKNYAYGTYNYDYFVWKANWTFLNDSFSKYLTIFFWIIK